MDVKVVHIFVRAGGSDLFLTAILMKNMAKCMKKNEIRAERDIAPLVLFMLGLPLSKR